MREREQRPPVHCVKQFHLSPADCVCVALGIQKGLFPSDVVVKCLFSLPPLLLLCIWLSIAVDDLFSSDISSSGYFRNAVERSDSRN